MRSCLESWWSNWLKKKKKKKKKNQSKESFSTKEKKERGGVQIYRVSPGWSPITPADAGMTVKRKGIPHPIML